MKVLNVEIANDHIREVKELSLTSPSLEQALMSFKYEGENKIKEPEVENLQIPPFATVFYGFVFDNDMAPSPTQFIEKYLSSSCFEYLPNGQIRVNYAEKSTIVSLEGLVGRVLRAYPSIVRDLHFYLMAKESNLFQYVMYSVKNDYDKKIDIQVKYNDQLFNVGLLLSSKRSLFFKAKKFFRHEDVDVIYIELKKEDARWVGDYMLYTPYHLNLLFKEINKRMKSKPTTK